MWNPSQTCGVHDLQQLSTTRCTGIFLTMFSVVMGLDPAILPTRNHGLHKAAELIRNHDLWPCKYIETLPYRVAKQLLDRQLLPLTDTAVLPEI